MALAKSLPLSGLQCPDIKSITSGSLRSFLILRMPVYELGQDALLLLTRGAPVPGNKHTDCWKKSSKCVIHPLHLQKTRYTSKPFWGEMGIY